MDLRTVLVLTLAVIFVFLFLLDKSSNVNGGGELEKLREVGAKADVMRVLRKLQASQVANLVNLNVDSLSKDEAMARFYQEVSSPVQGVCYSLKRMGGKWRPGNKAFDGDKFVCMDSYSPRDCLIYSFGVGGSLEFEDTVDQLNCTVHAYDPTVDIPSTRGAHIRFQKLGVAPARNPAKHMDTLKNIIAANGHEKKTLFYLKVDIEGAELIGMPEWIKSGALDRVDQLAMELHLGPIHQGQRFQWLLKLLQQLYSLGFRLISHEVNMTVKNQSPWQGYHSLLEVVLMKDSVWSFLDKTDKT